MADMQSPRLTKLDQNSLTAEQSALADSIKAGPRGQFRMSGPFAIYLHSPTFGELAQKLGGHLRFKTSVTPRLSEFAILCTAQEGAVRMVHARADGREGRRETGNRPRYPGGANAEEGAEGRAGDLRLCQRTLFDKARQHGRL